MDLLTIEHIRTGKVQQVTHDQFAKMTKLFPNSFRKANKDVKKYSPEAQKIIQDFKENGTGSGGIGSEEVATGEE